jgi:hypothetical protein
MNDTESIAEHVVRRANDLRLDLLSAAGAVRPHNMTVDGMTVGDALVAARVAIDAFLYQDDPDNEITGAASTE